MIPAFVPPPHYVAPRTLDDLIKHLGLGTSCSWIVDAGDAHSVPSSAVQTFGTLPAGSAAVWYNGLGTGVGSLADGDAVFSGVAGRQSSAERFRMEWLNGSDNTFLSTNPASFDATNAWAIPAHKDNATQTFVMVAQIDSADNGSYFIETCSGGGTGIIFGITDSGVSANHLNVNVQTGVSPFIAYAATTAATVPRDTPVFLAWSMNEPGNAAVLQINGTQETFTCTYGSGGSPPSAGGPDFTPDLGLTPHVSPSAGQGAYFHNAAWWGRALSATELMKLYTAQRPKFGF